MSPSTLFSLFSLSQDHLGFSGSQSCVELWSLFYPKKAVGSLDMVQGRIIKKITGCNRCSHQFGLCDGCCHLERGGLRRSYDQVVKS